MTVMGEDYRFSSEFNEKMSVPTRKIVRALSENARISISELSKILNLSRRTTKERMLKVEKELGIRYTLELNEEALGLTNPHIIAVKFAREPDYGEVSEILAGSHMPQIVMKARGNYDLLIYANAANRMDYVFWDKTTQVRLAKYGVQWQTSGVAFIHLGFCPIRNALIEKLDLPEKYKSMLLLLNENSRLSFHEISQKLGMHFNTVAYNFNKLVKMGYIKRFTIVVSKPPETTTIAMFGKYTISEGFEEASMKMRKEISWIDDDMPLISRYPFSIQLLGSYDFFFAGIYDNEKVGYDKLIKYYKNTYKKQNVKVAYATLQDTLLGDFPLRNVNSKKEFNMIRWIPDSQPVVTRPFA